MEGVNLGPQIVDQVIDVGHHVGADHDTERQAAPVADDGDVDRRPVGEAVSTIAPLQ